MPDGDEILGDDKLDTSDTFDQIIDFIDERNILSENVESGFYEKINKTRLNLVEQKALEKLNPDLYRELLLKQKNVEADLLKLKSEFVKLRTNDPHCLNIDAWETVLSEIKFKMNILPFENTKFMTSLPIPAIELEKVQLRKRFLELFGQLDFGNDQSLISMIGNNWQMFAAGVIDSLGHDYAMIADRFDVLVENPQLLMEAFKLTFDMLKLLSLADLHELAVDGLADFIYKVVETDGKNIPYEYGVLFGKALPFILTSGNSEDFSALKIASYASFQTGDISKNLADFDFYNKLLAILSDNYGEFNYDQILKLYSGFLDDYSALDQNKRVELNLGLVNLVKNGDTSVLGTKFVQDLIAKNF